MLFPYLPLVLLLALALDCPGQSHPHQWKAHYVQYGVDSRLAKDTTYQFQTKESPDLAACSNHTGMPFNFPARHEQQGEPEGSRVRFSHQAHPGSPSFHHTFTYDAQGRLASYAYSSCSSCHLPAFHYRISRNDKGQVIFIQNTRGWSERYELDYDEQGRLSQITRWWPDNGRTVLQLTEVLE